MKTVIASVGMLVGLLAAAPVANAEENPCQAVIAALLADEPPAVMEPLVRRCAEATPSTSSVCMPAELGCVEAFAQADPTNCRPVASVWTCDYEKSGWASGSAVALAGDVVASVFDSTVDCNWVTFGGSCETPHYSWTNTEAWGTPRCATTYAVLVTGAYGLAAQTSTDCY